VRQIKLTDVSFWLHIKTASGIVSYTNLIASFFQDTWVSRYQKGKTSLDLNEAIDNMGFLEAVASAGPYVNNLHLATDR